MWKWLESLQNNETIHMFVDIRQKWWRPMQIHDISWTCNAFDEIPPNVWQAVCKSTILYENHTSHPTYIKQSSNSAGVMEIVECVCSFPCWICVQSFPCGGFQTALPMRWSTCTVSNSMRLCIFNPVCFVSLKQIHAEMGDRLIGTPFLCSVWAKTVHAAFL